MIHGPVAAPLCINTPEGFRASRNLLASYMRKQEGFLLIACDLLGRISMPFILPGQGRAPKWRCEIERCSKEKEAFK